MTSYVGSEHLSSPDCIRVKKALEKETEDLRDSSGSPYFSSSSRCLDHSLYDWDFLSSLVVHTWIVEKERASI